MSRPLIGILLQFKFLKVCPRFFLKLITIRQNNLVVFSHKQDTENTYHAVDENYRECCFSQHLNSKDEFYYYWVANSDAKPETCVGLIHNGQVFTHADYWQLDARPLRPTKDEIFIPFQLPFKSYPVYCNMYKINKEKMNEYKNIALEIIRIEKAS